MPKKKTVPPKEENIEQSFDFQILKMLSDPMRVRIVLELLINKELSTKQLQTRIPIGRSTLGHHLQKLEENDLIAVRVQPKSYSVKYYSLSKSLDSKFSLKKAINIPDDEKRSRIILDAFSSMAGVLQFMANIAYESLRTLLENKIENVHERNQNTYYTVNEKENLFIPAQLTIISKKIAPDFIESLKEFIEKSSKITEDNKTLTNDDLPLYAFISTGFPITFQNSIEK